jgi:hypothetical protein
LIGEAPIGISACRRLFADMVRPRISKRRRILSAIGWSRRIGAHDLAMTSRVMSSCVGPRPPQQITASLRSSAWRMQASMRPKLSPTLTW